MRLFSNHERGALEPQLRGVGENGKEAIVAL